MKKQLFVVVSLFFSLALAEPITPETIARKQPQIPEELIRQVEDWQQRHPGVLQKLIPTTENTAMTPEEVFKEIKNSLQVLLEEKLIVPIRRIESERGTIILPRNNYVLELPEKVNGDHYVMVFSGPWHKLHALESFNGKGYHVRLNPEEDKKTATFQTSTQAFHAYKCNEIIDEHKITTFEKPEVFLVQVPDRPSMMEKACDENTLIVRKFYEEPWVSLEYNLEYATKLSSQQIKDLWTIIKGATLHFIGDDGNLMFNKDDCRLAMRDLQGPNDQNPDVPFNGGDLYKKTFSRSQRDTNDYYEYKKWHSISHAVCGFAKILKEAQEEGHQVTEQQEAFKENIATDDALNKIHKDLKSTIYKCAGVPE